MCENCRDGQPEAPTEKKYRKHMNFSDALINLGNGVSVARSGWNGKNQYITLQIPDSGSKMTEPYIYITFPNRDSRYNNSRVGRLPWLASQADLLANDWYVVSPE